LGEGSSKTRYMELAGLEPATSWVRFGGERSRAVVRERDRR
jgi:hypothetical protein